MATRKIALSFALGSLLAYLSAAILQSDANAKGWRICNRTAEDLDVAIAYKDRQDQWISKGWHGLRSCGGCAMVMDHGRTEYTDVFLHAKNGAGVVRFGGGARFCVTSSAFTVRNGPRCGGGYTAASFSKQVIASGDRDFVTNLTGRASGRVCID